MSRSYTGFYEIIAVLFNKKLLPWQLSYYLWDYSKEGQRRKDFILERMLIWPAEYKQCFALTTADCTATINQIQNPARDFEAQWSS